MTDGKAYPERSVGDLIIIGLRCRCPRCGTGSVLEGYLQVAERCSDCGLGLTGHDVGDGAVVPAMLVIGSVFVGSALFVEFTYTPPLWVHAVLWGPLVVAATLGILRPLKGLSIALQHRYRSTEETERLGGH